MSVWQLEKGRRPTRTGGVAVRHLGLGLLQAVLRIPGGSLPKIILLFPIAAFLCLLWAKRTFWAVYVLLPKTLIGALSPESS